MLEDEEDEEAEEADEEPLTDAATAAPLDRARKKPLPCRWQAFHNAPGSDGGSSDWEAASISSLVVEVGRRALRWPPLVSEGLRSGAAGHDEIE